MRIFSFAEAPTDAIFSFSRRGNLNLYQFSFKIFSSRTSKSCPRSSSSMAHSSLEKFVYSPLIEKRDFRLVTLHHGTDQDPISLAICHASLDQAPPYEALSYVWGPQNPSETIKCNDGALEIGKNLSGALRCLRKPTMSRVLWIDRVAINQERCEGADKPSRPHGRHIQLGS